MANWDDHRFFLAVARAASVRKAAEALRASRSTVTRRIEALERDLGVRLFERMAGGYFATPAGEELRKAAERIEAEALAARRRLSGETTAPGGVVRVSLSGPLMRYALTPDLAAFQRAHPEIRLVILNTYAMPDLGRGDVDVALRVSNDPPEDLVGRRLLRVARAAYLAADPALDPAELGWIAWSADGLSRQWIDASDHPDRPTALVVTDPYATVEAARAGMGMAMLPCFMGDQEPGLRRVPPGRLLRQDDLWALTREDLRSVARIRLFMDFIIAALLRRRALLEGLGAEKASQPTQER